MNRERIAVARYLTPDEAVTYLGLPSRNALKQRMKRKTIPAWCWTRMGGKSLRFVRASLDEWLQPKERVAALRLVGGVDVKSEVVAHPKRMAR